MKKVAHATDYLNMETKELFEIYSKDKNREIRDILIERHLYLANILSKIAYLLHK